MPIEWAPTFTSEITDQEFLIALQNDTNFFSFNLPEIFDANGDNVSTNIKSELFGVISTENNTLVTDFMSFDNNSGVLSLNLSLSLLQNIELT